MKRVQKGNYGYTRSHRTWQGIKAFSYGAVCLAVYLIGYLTTKTNENLMSVVAIVGVLPTTKEMIGFFMSFRRKPMELELYQKIQEKTEGMEVLYELDITTSERAYPVEAVVIKGREVVGYSEDPKCDPEILKKHIQQILKNNGYSEKVRIHTDLKKFFVQVQEMKRKAPEDIPYEHKKLYPELNRDQLIAHTICAISI